MFGAGVDPDEGGAGGSMPALRSMFIRAMGSGVVDAAGGCGSTRWGGGDLMATAAGGG